MDFHAPFLLAYLMYLNKIEKKWNLNLSELSSNNTSTKRFDFVIKTNNQVYVIETNFYASGGSKLNETARSYKMLAEESKKVDVLEQIIDYMGDKQEF